MKALSYVPFVGPRVMTEYERRVFEARTTLSNARAKNELGLTFRPHADTVADTVRGVFSSASRIDELSVMCV